MNTRLNFPYFIYLFDYFSLPINVNFINCFDLSLLNFHIIDCLFRISTFGSNFKVYTHPNVDNPDYKVVFTITRWPGSAPTDCGTSRNKIGITPKPSNNWLKITTTNPTDSSVSTPTGKPSTDYGTMGTTAGLDAEACSKDYAAEISATLIRKADNVNIGSVRCYTNIVISNTNEQPIIKASSLTQFNINTQTVPEDALRKSLHLYPCLHLIPVPN